MEQALSYLGEVMDEEGNVQMSFVKQQQHILRLDIQSRHCNRKKHQVFVDYEAGRNEVDGIRRYWCVCATGNRTEGCCAHVAAVVYYLPYGRYLPSIRRPAEALNELYRFSSDETESETDTE